MTEYTRNDLGEDWEFKIVRSESGAFRDSEVLNGLIEEEARAGWVMLEKFDDGRVRFKRARSARSRDAFLPADVDPYRTRYGSSASRQATMVGVILGLLLLGAGVAFFAVQGGRASAESVAAPVWTSVAVIPAILIVLGLVMAVVRRSR